MLSHQNFIFLFLSSLTFCGGMILASLRWHLQQTKMIKTTIALLISLTFFFHLSQAWEEGVFLTQYGENDKGCTQNATWASFTSSVECAQLDTRWHIKASWMKDDETRFKLSLYDGHNTKCEGKPIIDELWTTSQTTCNQIWGGFSVTRGKKWDFSERIIMFFVFITSDRFPILPDPNAYAEATFVGKDSCKIQGDPFYVHVTYEPVADVGKCGAASLNFLVLPFSKIPNY